MQLTEEQYKVINSTGNIKINAVAGSGKTTTIIEYAKARPKNSKILYIAFNKSVRLEAIRKFDEQGLTNVKVETAHSLAYKYIVYQNNYKVKAQGYKTHEIAELLGLEGNGEKHAEYIIANHINKFISYFCNSEVPKVKDLNYLDVVSDSKARTFVNTFYKYIEKQTRMLLGKMDKGEIEITHDFYMKKFQLSNPKLNYDYILFDEGQDASAAMIDVFLKQDSVKVIVGDTHQQIYGWRYAINSLEKVNFQTFDLSTSFRFNQDIATLAKDIVGLKKIIDSDISFNIIGSGHIDGHISKATIARTNLGLLLKAIEYVTENKKGKRIYFEGNINSYTYADDGTSLYDVLNLYNNQHSLIRDNMIKGMKNISELEDYIRKTEDTQLGMMVDIVKEYKNKIPNIIKTIKERHIEDDDKSKADMIFTTVHRCKGMEYDSIQLVDDFITRQELEKAVTEKKGDELNVAKLNEEINLLYVAVTRSKNILQIPATLIPDQVPITNQIHILNVIKEENFEPAPKKLKKKKIWENEEEKAYYFDEIRKDYNTAYYPWTIERDIELSEMYKNGINIKDLAKHFGRSKGAIKSRIKKLKLDF